MSYSDLYDRVKHHGYEPSSSDMERLRHDLSRSDSIHDAESHVLIRIFCKFATPTSDNVAIIEKFLSEETNDYARSAAILCMITEWSLFDNKYRRYIIDRLSALDVEDYFETTARAFVSALHMSKEAGDADLNECIVSSYSRLRSLASSDQLHYSALLETVYDAICIDAMQAGEDFAFSTSVQQAIRDSHILIDYLTSRGLAISQSVSKKR